MQALKGGGVAEPDHVRPASLALQPFAQEDPTNQRLEPKSYNGPSARDYKVDDCLLDVEMGCLRVSTNMSGVGCG